MAEFHRLVFMAGLVARRIDSTNLSRCQTEKSPGFTNPGRGRTKHGVRADKQAAKLATMVTIFSLDWVLSLPIRFYASAEWSP